MLLLPATTTGTDRVDLKDDNDSKDNENGRAILASSSNFYAAVLGQIPGALLSSNPKSLISSPWVRRFSGKRVRFRLVVSGPTSAGVTMSFFRHEEIYRPDGTNSLTRSGPQTAPRTIGFDESPAGYSLASCSPAELASASPADGDSEAEVTV
jgi:hypothetical protein